MSNRDVQSVVETGDSFVRVDDFVEPEPKDFVDAGTIAVLIHGFTSHGRYMRGLAESLRKWGNQVFLFNYNSFEGIGRAAQSLSTFLAGYDRLAKGALSSTGIYLVAHSMGGLVARSVISDIEMRKLVRGIVMLGTPNGGVFRDGDRKVLHSIITYGEYITGPMPRTRALVCISARQLIKDDGNGNKPYIDQLNESEGNINSLPATLTISGGRRHLDFSDNRLKNQLMNITLQKLIGHEENDGLINESSVDMSIFMPDGWDTQ